MQKYSFCCSNKPKILNLLSLKPKNTEKKKSKD